MRSGKVENFKMATVNISSGSMRKYHSDQFEKLYNKTLLESPRAKFYLKELSHGKKVTTPQNEQQWKSPQGRAPHTRMAAAPIPKTRGSVKKHMMSPAAKIIQQMKMADAREKAATGHAQETSQSNSQPKLNQSLDHDKSREKPTIEHEQNEDIPSFECSDNSSDSSTSSDEQHNDEQQSKSSGKMQKGDKTPNGNAHGKPNLHDVVQEYRSPQKQIPTSASGVTPVRLTRSKSRTPTGEDLQLSASVGDLQRSLTPELKAARVEDLAKRSPSPKTRNTFYRNKKINLNKSLSSQDPKTGGQVVEEESIQLPDDDNDNDPPDPGVDDQVKDVETGERQAVPEVSTQVTRKDNPKPETPSTVAGLHHGSMEQDDETPKNSKMSKSISSNETVLDDWFIQISPNRKGIRLQGHRDGDPPDSFWNSSVITQRVSHTTLTTKSGSVYKLVGKINKDMAREEGFTVKVIKQFQNGFPVNWKEILSEFMRRDSARNEEVITAVTPAVKARKSKVHTRQSKKKQATPADAVPRTPQNTVTINELPRSSRSGRMIKPPLAFWVNQRVRHNLSTDTVEIIAGGTDFLSIAGKNLTGSTELSQEELARTKRTKLREQRRLQKSKNTKLSKCESTAHPESTDTEDVIDLILSNDENDKDSTLPTDKQQNSVRHKDTESLENKKTGKQKNRQEKLDENTKHSDVDSTSNEGNYKDPLAPRKTRSKQSMKGVKQGNTESSLDEDHLTDPPASPRRTRSRRSRENDQQGDSESASDENHLKHPPAPSRKTRSRRSRETDEQGDTESSSDENHLIDPPASPRKTRSKRRKQNDKQGDSESACDEYHLVDPPSPSRKTRSRRSRENGEQGNTESASNENHGRHPPAPSRKTRSKRSKETDEQDDTESSSDEKHLTDPPALTKTRSKQSKKGDEQGDTESASNENHLVDLSAARKFKSKRTTKDKEHEDTESSSDETLHKDPPAPPKKNKFKKSSNFSSLPKSPLYYTLSPDVLSDDNSGTKYKKQPVVGQTPSVVHPSVAGLTPNNENQDQDTPRTAGLKVDAVKHGGAAEILLSDVKKKFGSHKTLGSSPLNLQQEVVSVLQRYKKKRTAKMQERSARLEQLRKTTSFQQKTTKSSDIYDLDNSSDEFEKTSRLFRKRTGSYLKSDSDIFLSDECKKTERQTSKNPNPPSKTAPVDGTESKDFTAIAASDDSKSQNSSSSSTLKSSEAKVATSKMEQTSKQKTQKGKLSKNAQAKSSQKSTRTRNRTRSSESKLSDVSLVSEEDSDRRLSEKATHLSAKRTELADAQSLRKPPRQRTRRSAAKNEKVIVIEDTESSSSCEMISLRPFQRPNGPNSSRYPRRAHSRNVSYVEDDVRMKRVKRTTTTNTESIGSDDSTEDTPIRKRERKYAKRRIRNKSGQSKNMTGPNKKGGKPSKDANVTRKEVARQSTEKKNESCTDGENKWSSEELAKLKSAMEVVAPGTSMFWQCVASLVESKSAEMCQLKHQESLEKQASHQETSRKKTNDKIEEEKKDPVKLTAKMGTMKRKRQLRELVEQHNQGHEEDYFDSTPFKRKNKRLKISASLESDDEDNESGQPLKTPGSARFKTPSVRRPWGLEPLSDKKTPHTNILSPWTGTNVNRNYIDTYINGIQKKKKVRTLVPQSTPFIKKKIAKAKKDTSVELAASKASAAGLFDVRPASDGSDSEEESDYYWSEEEQE